MITMSITPVSLSASLSEISTIPMSESGDPSDMDLRQTRSSQRSQSGASSRASSVGSESSQISYPPGTRRRRKRTSVNVDSRELMRRAQSSDDGQGNQSAEAPRARRSLGRRASFSSTQDTFTQELRALLRGSAENDVSDDRGAQEASHVIVEKKLQDVDQDLLLSSLESRQRHELSAKLKRQEERHEKVVKHMKKSLQLYKEQIDRLEIRLADEKRKNDNLKRELRIQRDEIERLRGGPRKTEHIFASFTAGKPSAADLLSRLMKPEPERTAR